MDKYSRLKGSKTESTLVICKIYIFGIFHLEFVDLTSSEDVKSSTCQDLIPADEKDMNKGLEKYIRLKGSISEGINIHVGYTVICKNYFGLSHL